MSDEEAVYKYGKEILKSNKYKRLKEFRHHGNMTVMDHSIRVAEMSWRIVEFFHIKCNRKDLIQGCLLHDYFLYDWHEIKNRMRLHGFRHPKIALENAERDFEIDKVEADMIEKHMWPLTIRLPKYKETWVIILSDKLVAISDMFIKPAFAA